MILRKLLYQRYTALLLTLFLAGSGFTMVSAAQESGYDLWLNYKPVADHSLRNEYASYCGEIKLAGSRFDSAISFELDRALGKMVGLAPKYTGRNGARLRMAVTRGQGLGAEGYRIREKKGKLYIEAGGDAGLLYGTFHLLRLMQCGQSLEGLDIAENPKYDLRQLNHWDDIDGHIERGYAGKSLWKWDELPRKVDPRYRDYARANASVGINGVVLNNVNADPRFLRRDYLEKIAALADIFRQYNIKVYLTANFAAPLKPSSTPDVMKRWGGVGDLDTADPRDPAVQAWWAAKTEEIYSLIPDFGGFLVKANSEGMPGPQDYRCTHAEGANLLARALKPFGGIVMWRTFVYNPNVDPDRVKRSYKEFMPLDGKFDDNVILQTKNGPLDFQPSEPVQPLFGAMKHTPLQPELQITQEYTGQSTYLVYLVPMWRKFFDFDTGCNGKGSTVAAITEGRVYPQKFTAIAGVANTGDTVNWTGHHFAQANWYAFGRLAWNPSAPTSAITREWIRSTWNCDDQAAATIEEMMMPTWESFVAAQSPHGLGLTVKVEGHFRAGFAMRAGKEWRADKNGIGSDRTSAGTDYVSQYFEPARSMFDNIATCPEELLLCFHYAPWGHRMKSGATLREDFFAGLRRGMEQAERNIALWESLRGKIDGRRFEEVMRSLEKERADAEEFYNEAYSFFSNALEAEESASTQNQK